PLPYTTLFRSVLLVLQRPVNASVRRIEIQVAKVSLPPLQRPDQLATEVVPRQQVGEGVVDVSPLHIHRDALHVAGRPGTGVLSKRWRQRRAQRLMHRKAKTQRKQQGEPGSRQHSFVGPIPEKQCSVPASIRTGLAESAGILSTKRYRTITSACTRHDVRMTVADALARPAWPA